MKEYLERGTNLEVNQVEAQEQEEYLSLSLSPSLLPQSRLSLSLSGERSRAKKWWHYYY